MRSVKAVTLSVLAALAALLLLGGGQAFAHTAAAPPGIVIEVIGAGKVTGTGIGCGLGSLQVRRDLQRRLDTSR